MNNPLHLTDVFPLWISGNGIFSALQSFDVPWKSENINADLDLEYYGNVSGDKIISPLIAKVMSGSVLSQTEVNMLASTIYNINGLNWTKLWATLNMQYNPIENYNMIEEMTDDETVTEYGKTITRTNNLSHAKTGTETETPDITETRTDNLTHAKSGTETTTPDIEEERTDRLSHTKTGTEQIQPNTTETTTPNLSNTTTNGLYGFNSATASDSSTSATSATGTNTVTKTGTETTTYNTTEGNTGTQTTTKTGTEEIAYDIDETETGTQTVTRDGTNQVTYNVSETDTGTSADAATGSDVNTRNYLLTRSGNIGVTTSQQMIESERELWKFNFFRDVVFPDVDRVLSLLIY